jgi:hypothetical protein
MRTETASAWEKWLDQHAIKSERHRRIITEGALMGGLLAQGIPVNLSIVSDDAGQFNVFRPAAMHGFMPNASSTAASP